MSTLTKPLILIGMMGSGKTTVGALLAERLGVRFVDLDEAVVARAGRSIPEIFAVEGEERFRQWETDLLRETLSSTDPAVVALGGGTWLGQPNRELARNARVVWLDADAKTVWQRVGEDANRPLLQGLGPEGLATLLASRRSVYAAHHHLAVDVSDREPEAIASAIMAWLEGEERTMANPSNAWTIRFDESQTGRVEMVPDGVAEWFSAQEYSGGRVWVVYDQAVEKFAQTVIAGLSQSGAAVQGNGVVISEAAKTLQTVEMMYNAMAAAGLSRDSLVVAVGGGVLTDTAGFAAATYLRGVRWIAVPTTLLGQVDAAIGGKVAVNLPAGKNLVGAFCLPEAVLLSAEPLTTLPAGEWKAGLGEVVKSALIAGGALWERLGRGVPPLGESLSQWLPIIAETARIKVDVVNRDPRERHDRMFLNFGHTLGHAIEQISGYGTLKHGEAVGLGTLYALRLSELALGLDPGVRETVHRWLVDWGLPVAMPGLTLEKVEPVLMRDKKARAFGLQWILLDQVGFPRVVSNLDPEQLSRALEVLAS